MAIAIRQERLNLFDGKENLSIFHISDTHLKFSVLRLKIIRAKIEEKKPDLILLTGDYYDLPIGASHFRKFLVDIAETNTIAFIKGNHDSIFGAKISNFLLGIPNCYSVENSLYRFKSRNGYFYNITSWTNKDYLPLNKDEKNIVLIHNPEKIITNEVSNIDLILAGHLHGGQFIFFKTKRGSNFPACVLYNHCADRKQIENTTLIVSKGLGDTFPFRFNCPKEIVHIRID